MKLFWRMMKEAAYRRHEILVTALHSHDKIRFRKELNRHYAFVDAVYNPVMKNVWSERIYMGD